MNSIKVDSSISEKLPNLNLGIIQCEVKVELENTLLWQRIDQEVETLREQMLIEAIAKLPVIQASRRAYKAVGKDPARYRLSAEALLRRVLQGKGLYKINNLVDLLNLVSIKSGFSIGGYNTAKIKGDVILGIGKKDEIYQGIGKGQLNIENLPVLRDDKGAFGSPTSDSVRTSVDDSTSHFTMVIFNFEGDPSMDSAIDFAKTLLLEYGFGKNILVNKI